MNIKLEITYSSNWSKVCEYQNEQIENVRNLDYVKDRLPCMPLWVDEIALPYVLRNIDNITLKPSDPYGLTKDDVYCEWATMRQLESITRDGLFMTPPFFMEGFHIYSCLDGEGVLDEVFLPKDALGSMLWHFLLVFFLGISLITALLFKRHSKPDTNLITHILNSCFFYISHYLLNPQKGWSRRVSWRLLVSGWIVGVDIILNRCYLGNLKGELVTAKIRYIDTLDDLLTRTDLNVYASSDSFKDSYQTGKYSSIAREAKVRFPLENWKLQNAAIISTAFYSGMIRKKKMLANCENVYEGQGEFSKQIYYIGFEKRIPSLIRKRAHYLVRRFVETMQDIPYLRYWSRKSEVEPFYVTANAKPTTINFFGPIFKYWCYGISVSIVCIIFEFVFKFYGYILKFLKRYGNSRLINLLPIK